MHTGRILYLNHDNPQPSGGVQVIYDHVQHLVRNGYRAYVVHQHSGFRPAWFDDRVPTLYLDHQFSLRPDDLVIIPEDHTDFIELFRTAAVRKILFCQNHFYLYEGLRQYNTLHAADISGVMACSDIVADFFHTHMMMSYVQTVHNAIPAKFSPTSHKKFQVAYMPRKRSLEANFIKSLCMRLLEPEYEVEWIALDGMSQDAVARALADSAIFLSLSRLEGFGLPPLEAMASGCLVVGFTGFGGREYARSDNGLWVAEDDLIHCAQTLAEAVRMFQRNPHETIRLTSNARKTAAGYTSKRQEQELLQALHHFLHCQTETDMSKKESTTIKVESTSMSRGSLAEKQMLVAVAASGGLQTEAEALTLYRLASSLPDCSHILEIGSYLGASSTALGHGILSSNSALYCLDCWRDYQKQGFHASGIMPSNTSDLDIFSRFIQSTSFLGEQLRILKGTTSELAPLLPDHFFDLIFVDGAHDYDNVLFDIHLALRVIKPQGLVCGHDYHNDGLEVVQAVDELIYQNTQITIKGVFPGTSIWYAVMPEALKQP